MRTAVAHGLGHAELLNGAGNYVLPTNTTIEREAASFTEVPADAELALIDSRTATYGYPIVTFEYAVVDTTQASSATAAAIRSFLAWGMDPRYGSTTATLSPFFAHALFPSSMQIAVNLLRQVN